MASSIQRSRSRADELRRSTSYDASLSSSSSPAVATGNNATTSSSSPTTIRAANIIYDQIKNDPRIDTSAIIIGFGFTTTLAHATLEQPFDEYSLVDHPTPFNRIAFFKYKGRIVWDRRRNLDQLLELFPLSSDGSIAPGGVMATGGDLPPLIRRIDGIYQLPTSLLVHIFDAIDVRWAAPRLPLVCRDWSTALRSGYLWREWFCNVYPLAPSSIAALAAITNHSGVMSPPALGRKISDGKDSGIAEGHGEVDEEGSDGVQWRSTYRDRSLIAAWCNKYPRLAIVTNTPSSSTDDSRPRSPGRDRSGGGSSSSSSSSSSTSSSSGRLRAGSGGGTAVGSPPRASSMMVGSPPRDTMTTQAPSPAPIAGNMDFVMRETEGKRERGSRDRRDRDRDRDRNDRDHSNNNTTEIKRSSSTSSSLAITIPNALSLSARGRTGSGRGTSGYGNDDNDANGPPSPSGQSPGSSRFSPPVRSTSSYSLSTTSSAAAAPIPVASSTTAVSSSSTSSSSLPSSPPLTAVAGSSPSGLTGALPTSASSTALAYAPLVMRGHRAPVTCIRFDRTKVAYAADKFIRVYSLQTGRSLGNIKGNFGDVTCLDFTSHVMVSGSTDRTIRTYDWDTMDLKRATAKRAGHRDTVTVVKLIGNSERMVSAALDGMIKTWDTDQGQCLRTYNDGDPDSVGGICAMDAISEHEYATGSGTTKPAGRVALWDVRTSKGVTTVVPTACNVVSAISVHAPSHALAAGGSDGMLRIWDTRMITTTRPIAIIATMEGSQPVMLPPTPAIPVPAPPPPVGAAAIAAAREAATQQRSEAIRVLIRSVHIDQHRLITCQQRGIGIFQASGHSAPVYGSVLPYAHRVRQFSIADFSAYYTSYAGLVQDYHCVKYDAHDDVLAVATTECVMIWGAKQSSHETDTMDGTTLLDDMKRRNGTTNDEPRRAVRNRRDRRDMNRREKRPPNKEKKNNNNRSSAKDNIGSDDSSDDDDDEDIRPQQSSSSRRGGSKR